MEFIVNSTPRRVDTWMNDYINPGPVASVGDVLVNEKLRKSYPDLTPRYSYKVTSLKRRGVGGQDGQWYNGHNGGLGAKVNRISYYEQNYDLKANGSSMQDVRLQDLKADTRVLSAPQFGWKNTQATILNARVTGEQFLPLPQGYMPEGVSRGPQPRVNTLVDNTTAIGPVTPLKSLEPVVTNVPSNGPIYAGGPIYGTENIQQPVPKAILQRGVFGTSLQRL